MVIHHRTWFDRGPKSQLVRQPFRYLVQPLLRQSLSVAEKNVHNEDIFRVLVVYRN